MSRGALAAVLVTLLALVGAPAAVAQEQDPQGASPPGANDFSCRPSADKPHPVVLLHGLSADMRINFGQMSPALKAAGFCVFALDYGNRGTRPLRESIQQIAAFVDRVREATGQRRVALLGHSEGAVQSRHLVKRFGPEGVSHAVLVAGPLHGTSFPFASMGNLIGCFSCVDFAPGSDFNREINQGADAPLPVKWLTVVTKLDELVLPYTSGLLDPVLGNVRNVTLQDQEPANTSEHLAIIADAITIRESIAWLSQPATALPGSAAPRLRLTRRCTGGGRLRMNVVGDDSAVRDVNFKLDRRLIARDTAARFERTLGRETLRRSTARRLRAVAYLKGSGRVVLSRSLPRCGLR